MKIKVRNQQDGSAIVTGTVDPKLPGRILWLRTNAVKPSARTTTRSDGSSRCASSSRGPAATRPSSSPRRARRAVVPRTQESSDEAVPFRRRSASLPPRSPCRRPRPRIRASTRRSSSRTRPRADNDACRITDAVDNDVCIQDNQRTTYAVGNDGYAMGFTEGAPTTPSTLTNGAPAGAAWSTTASCRAPGAARPTTTTARCGWRTRPRRPTCRRTRPASAPRGTRPRTSSPGRTTRSTTTSRGRRRRVGIGDEPAKWIAVVKDRPPASTSPR